MDKPEKETLSAFIKQKYPEIWEEYAQRKYDKRKEWHRQYMQRRYIKARYLPIMKQIIEDNKRKYGSGTEQPKTQ